MYLLQNLLRKARKEGLIQNDWFAHVLIKEVVCRNIANTQARILYSNFKRCSCLGGLYGEHEWNAHLLWLD